MLKSIHHDIKCINLCIIFLLNLFSMFRKWALLPGTIMNWNQKPSAISKTLYRSGIPTLEPQLLEKWNEELKKQGYYF